MAMPRQIEQAAAEADQLQKQLYGVESPATAPEADQPVSEPVAAEPATEAPVVEVRQAEPAKPPETGEDAAYWKQRCNTVQGKLEAEMPRLYQQLREKDQKLQETLERLAEREAAPAKSEEALVTEKDMDTFGGDLIDLMGRKATEIVRREIAAALAEFRKEFGVVREQVGQVTERVVESEMDRFWAGVMNLVPDWPVIDADPRWISWLDTAPPFAEETYRALAGKAIARGKPDKIAKLVETWKKETGAPPVEPPRTSKQHELSSQVAPSTTRVTSTPVAERLWTKSDYEAAYDVRNVQRFGPEKAAQMAADADRAVAEGRVRW